MTVGRTILLLGLPLFLLLATLNSALLYFQERAESASARQAQAAAAAVTVAEFVRERPELITALDSPARRAAMRSAARLVPGLDSLAVVAGTRPVIVLKAPTDGNLAIPPSAAPLDVVPERTVGDHRRIVTAVASAGHGLRVVANVGSSESPSGISDLAALIAIMVIAASVVGGVVSFLFARKVKSELAVASDLIEAVRAGRVPARGQWFRIQEIGELGDAVCMMATNLASALARLQRGNGDQSADLAESVLSYHAEAMAPVDAIVAGVAVSMRHIGTTLPGSFFAWAENDAGGCIVLGSCGGGDASTALANALCARRFLAAAMLAMPADEAVALARQGFDLRRVEWRIWSRNEAETTRRTALSLLTILEPDDARAADAYVAQVQMLTPGEVVGDIALLLADAAGTVAVLRSAPGGGTEAEEDRRSTEADRLSDTGR